VSINTASKPRPRKQPQITKHVIFHAGKNLATWGRIQRDESWWWSASHEECHLLLSYWNPFCPSSRKATATQQTRHFSCRQKPSHPRSHSTRRKMTMIYFKKRVSSFADSLKSFYAMSSRGLQNEINGFLNCLKKVFSSCRIHLRTAIPDRELQHPCLCHFTKPIRIRIDTRSISSPVWLQNYNNKPQCHSHAQCKWSYDIWGGTGWFNYKALDEPYKAHFARTCIRLEVNRLLFVRLNF